MRIKVLFPIVFLISLSLIGLEVPILGHVICGLTLIKFYFHNKYDFIIALTILITVNGFYDFEKDFPIKLYDIILLCCPILAIYYSTKDRFVLKIVIATIIFLFGLSVFMILSEESFNIQFRTARQYLCIFYFILPLIIFRPGEFSIVYFSKRSMVFITLVCLMYVIDGLIIHENLFLPGVNGATSTWNNLHLNLDPGIKRIYPAGLFILFLVLFVRRHTKLLPIHIFILGLALIASQTFSFILGFVITLFLFSSLRNKVKLLVVGCFVFLFALQIEKRAGVNLRIGEFVRQISALNNEHSDVAEFGSQRGGQVLPSLKKLKKDKLLWTGVGFLHNELTTSGKFMVESYFNKEPDVMGIVEVTQMATLISIGILGLLFLHIYFFGLYFILPSKSDRRVYLETVVLFSLFGIGGFSGLNGYPTIIWLGMCVGIILVSHQQRMFENRLVEMVLKDQRLQNHLIQHSINHV